MRYRQGRQSGHGTPGNQESPSDKIFLSKALEAAGGGSEPSFIGITPSTAPAITRRESQHRKQPS